MSQKGTRGAAAWVERLGKMDMPVLSGVLKELNDLSECDDTSANQLADAILKDASLTSQVLRIANSVHYNPQLGSQVSTISRAVVQVGFSGVRAICISVMVIDSLLGKQPREELLKCMAQGFHAGVQARNLVANFDEHLKEDAFIAALLMHVGDMAFWSRGGKQAAEFDQLLQGKNSNRDDIAHKLLGTDMKSISLGLAKQWGLGENLIESLVNPKSSKPAVRCAVLGEEISAVAELGWDSPEFGEVLAKASEFTGRSISDIKEQVLASADEASSVATAFGAHQVCHFMPSSSGPSELSEANTGFIPDAQLQLDILREITSMVSQNTDMNTLLQMVIEGMHRGVGMERVAILLINRDASELVAKYMLGEGSEEWRNNFHFAARREDDNIFAHSFHLKRNMELSGKKDPKVKNLLTLECLKVIGKGGSLLAPLFAGERKIGVFYADRGDSGMEVSKEQKECFRYFAQQANEGLEKLAAQKAKNAKQALNNSA
jgi:HD-like signal output (HDOD) protein